MRNEDKLKLAKKRKEQHGKELQRQQYQSEQKTKEELDALASIKESIDSLARTLQVTVDLPGLSSLAEKLKPLDQLPDTFSDVKSLSFAISNKLQALVDNSKDKQIISVRGFAEANKRFENIDKNIEKLVQFLAR